MRQLLSSYCCLLHVPAPTVHADDSLEAPIESFSSQRVVTVGMHCGWCVACLCALLPIEVRAHRGNVPETYRIDRNTMVGSSLRLR